MLCSSRSARTRHANAVTRFVRNALPCFQGRCQPAGPRRYYAAEVNEPNSVQGNPAGGLAGTEICAEPSRSCNTDSHFQFTPNLAIMKLGFNSLAAMFTHRSFANGRRRPCPTWSSSARLISTNISSGVKIRRVRLRLPLTCQPSTDRLWMSISINWGGMHRNPITVKRKNMPDVTFPVRLADGIKEVAGQSTFQTAPAHRLPPRMRRC